MREVHNRVPDDFGCQWLHGDFSIIIAVAAGRALPQRRSRASLRIATFRQLGWLRWNIEARRVFAPFFDRVFRQGRNLPCCWDYPVPVFQFALDICDVGGPMFTAFRQRPKTYPLWNKKIRRSAPRGSLSPPGRAKGAEELSLLLGSRHPRMRFPGRNA